MGRGVIEWQGNSGTWWKENGTTLDVALELALEGFLVNPRRYREGKRAVMLWPEERMGEVVDCG